MKAIRTISPTTARRLFIAQQRLAGARPPANAAGIMEVVRDLGCLQLDPISAVARSRMLDFLWMKGEIMVASRAGGQKLWDLSTRVLPEWTPRERLSERQVVYRAAQKSLRALGVGDARDIANHFISGRYPNLADTLER